MPSTARPDLRWAVLVGLVGVVAAIMVYVLTTDLIWTAVPLLLTVAAVRRVLQRRTPGR